MKTPQLILLLLCSALSYGQTAYTEFSIDPNKAFGIVDNPRTEVQKRGLDFDLELGATENRVGVYVFYGAFFEMDYMNYGLGSDYYFLKGNNFDLSAGLGISSIMRKYHIGIKDDTAWGNSLGWHSRLKGTVWVFPKFGISGRLQFQSRPDIDVYGIIEGSIGLIYKFKTR